MSLDPANPFARPSTLPYQLTPWRDVRAEHYLPAVEAGIAASLLVLGLLVALAARLPLTASLALVAAFALFHGHAHHAEMGDATLLGYSLGFALASATLHAAGLALARAFPDSRGGRLALHLGGGGIAGVGVALLGG